MEGSGLCSIIEEIKAETGSQTSILVETTTTTMVEDQLEAQMENSLVETISIRS